jgi:hypothetical protein
VVEEYEEEIPIQEGVSELADTADTVPAQGKPQCIILILLITVYIYICCAFMLQEMLPYIYIYIYIYIYECY